MSSKRCPRHADEFTSLAVRREWLESLPDERTRITTTPTKKRLNAANDNRRLGALDASDALMLPHSPDCIPDPTEPLDTAAVGRGWRMRPDEGEIERAMLGRVAVRSAPGRTHAERSRGGTLHIGGLVFTKTRRFERGPVLVLDRVVTGNILVPAGSLIERGRSRNGGVLRPCEYRTFDRPDPEVKQKAELAGKRAIRSYIKLHGTWEGYESWADRVGGVPSTLQRPPEAAVLDALGVSGAVDFATARRNGGLPPAEKCEDGYWWRGHWLGGVTRPRAIASGNDGHAKRAHDMAIRILVQKWLAERLSGDEFRILALATSSVTAAEAGADLGMTRQKYVLAANDTLEKVAVLLAA